MITRKDFVDVVLVESPHLREELEEDAGLPYLQMGTFSRLMQEARGRADWDLYRRAATLADRLWEDADDGLRNALNVSLLEHLDFDGRRGAEAWSLLSPRLQRAWQSMSAYNSWLHAGAKGEPPPEAPE